METTDFHLSYIDARWKQLYDLEKETGLEVLNYLFLCNAGGAATVLAFIGAGKGNGWLAMACLGSMVLGIIFSGLSRVLHFFHMHGLFEHWKALVLDFRTGRKTWNEIISLDRNKAIPSCMLYLLPAFSFICFIIGAGLGFGGLLEVGS